MNYARTPNGGLLITVPPEEVGMFMRWISDERSAMMYEAFNQQMRALQDDCDPQ